MVAVLVATTVVGVTIDAIFDLHLAGLVVALALGYYAVQNWGDRS